MWRLDNPLGCDRNVVRPAHQGTPEPWRECPAPKRTLRSALFSLLKTGFYRGRFGEGEMPPHQSGSDCTQSRLFRGTGFQPVKTRPRWPCHWSGLICQRV